MNHRFKDFPAAICEFESGNYAEALNKVDALLVSGHANTDVFNLAGLCCARQHRFVDAETYYTQAIAASPNHVATACNLADLWRQLGRLDDALLLMQRIVEVCPGEATPYYVIALVLTDLKRENDAIAALRQALTIDPEYFDACLLLAAKLTLRPHSEEETEAVLLRALALRPDVADLHAALGVVRTKFGELRQGIESFRQGIGVDPENIASHRNLILYSMMLADDSKDILEKGARFAARYETPLLANAPTPERNRNPERKLRIGYVSANFRYHSHSYFLIPVLQNHNRNAFEIFCYSKADAYSTVDTSDHFTSHYESLADVWQDVKSLNDEELAARISEDQIDILIDTTLHGRNSVLLMCARRPAPVQIQWLAYAGTTGFRSIDYHITDPWINPQGDASIGEDYSEKLIRLPQAYLCGDPRLGLPHRIPTIGPLPAKRNRYITFAFLGAPNRLSDQTLQLWSTILTRLPRARLILCADPSVRARVSSRLQSFDIDISRVNFVDVRGRFDYLSTYNHVDIGLSSYPYNGFTIGMDAMWMGVPTPFRIGKAAWTRTGLSLLMNAGLSELVATTDEEYVSIVVRLAEDLPRLARMRARLRRQLERSPLMDARGFTKDFENCLRDAWRAYCSSSSEH